MKWRIALCSAWVCLASACTDEPIVALPDVSRATFVDGIDHPYLPLRVGASWLYEAVTPDGLERDEVIVLAETRIIEGVTATVVHDVVRLDGVIEEETLDWYAQDTEGNVWYLGEDTCEFEFGECVSHTGAWEWGVDGALPGILMPGQPLLGTGPMYQEFYPGEAEDVGEVIAIGGQISAPAGSFGDCITTRETSTLDSSLDELKHYCRGIGLVRVEEPDFDVSLIGYSFP